MIIKTIYQKITPNLVRRRIGKVKTQLNGYLLKRKIISFLEKNELNETQDVVKWLRRNKLGVFPYDFINNYRQEDISVYSDDNNDLFCYWNGKKVYGKRGWDRNTMQEYFNFLSAEQDIKSPHKYLLNDERVPRGCTVADIGGAEGNFSLEIIDEAKKIYIFERDPEWLYALKKTFAPYSDKVEIVPYYVGKKNSDDQIKLDTFFEDKDCDYIKADIEGAELDMLLGSTSILRDKVKKILLCAYHFKNDEDLLKQELEKYDFCVEHNPGYMFFMEHMDDFKPPYVRRGVLFGKKISYGE